MPRLLRRGRSPAPMPGRRPRGTRRQAGAGALGPGIRPPAEPDPSGTLRAGDRIDRDGPPQLQRAVLADDPSTNRCLARTAPPEEQDALKFARLVDGHQDRAAVHCWQATVPRRASVRGGRAEPQRGARASQGVSRAAAALRGAAETLREMTADSLTFNRLMVRGEKALAQVLRRGPQCAPAPIPGAVQPAGATLSGRHVRHKCTSDVSRVAGGCSPRRIKRDTSPSSLPDGPRVIVR